MTQPSHPHYHQFSHSLLSLAILTTAIYLGQDILVPLALAGLLAVLLQPVEAWFINKGVHKVIAITIALTLAIIVITAIGFLLAVQLSDFTDNWPTLKQHLNEIYYKIRHWIRQEYNVSYVQQEKYIKQAQSQTMDVDAAVITGPLGTLLLMPIYVFLLLFYRSMLLHFVIVLFPESQLNRVQDILTAIKAVVQNYMVGLLIETACVAALNSVGLLIFGIQYPILLGVMAAILNLVPYIGGLVATLLAVVITASSQPELATMAKVLGVFLVVQFIDNNVLVPFIVASKVRINALISIVGVLIGGALAGVSGMFLSIPAIAILKIIFDRVDSLRPWGVLLGDQTPEQEGSKLFRLPKNRWRKKKLQS